MEAAPTIVLMIRRCLATVFMLAATITPLISAHAQVAPRADTPTPAVPPAAPPAAPEPALRVYLDCRTWGCDRDLFITELHFATLTRDRADADVHLLVTALGTGSGGRQLTLQFIGLRAFTGRADTVITSLPPNIADDRTRREIIRVAKLGLVRYALGSSVAAGLRLDDSAVPAALRDAALLENDPWDFWVISVGANGGSSAESRTSRASLGTFINARRVTDAWKVNIASSGNYRQANYKLTDTTSSAYILRDYGLRGRVVRNAGAHWSMGAIGNVGHTDYANQDTYARLGATFEYSIFPWSQATSRQLVAAWSVAVQHFDYHETTIYLKDRQTLAHQQAIVAGSTRQPWGNVDLSINWSQYLTDRSKNFFGLNSNASLRITRGLALNVSAYANRVRDQLYLPRGEATTDEILTQQRALATSFTRGGSLSVSYTFGSIYNTVVNPRLDVLGGF